jgi:hypothetical protein
MRHLKLTRHARQRLQQRGGRAKEVAIVIAHGDIEILAERGCRFLRLSHGACAMLFQGGAYRVQDLDRARRLVVLVSSTDEVVTVFKYDPERRFPGCRALRR